MKIKTKQKSFMFESGTRAVNNKVTAASPVTTLGKPLGKEKAMGMGKVKIMVRK